jgi:hypothetical protein
VRAAETDGVGRRFLLVVVFALLVVPVTDAADVLTSGRYVRNAIPAMEAYAADHGSYKGATVAKLRRLYDRSLGHIVIRTATRRTYCIESTTRPYAHKAGPGAQVSTGRCGTRGNPIEFTPPPSNNPPTTAEQRIRAAVPAMEAYAADHNGYAGMTLAAIQKYDYGIADITIVRASRDTYCVESGAGAEQRNKNGPGDPISAGPCPA